MAAPITHIVLAAKIFDKYFKDKERRDFFIGTSFPDIRYLKVITRDKTHYQGLKISDLKNDESFLAGLKFHSIVDLARESFIVENNIYSLCPESKYITQSLKILEDEIFYHHIKDWTIYTNYFQKILSSERNYGIAETDLKKWHTSLCQYFQKEPNKETITNFTLALGFPQEVADETNQNIDAMRENKQIIKIIENLYENFESLIK